MASLHAVVAHPDGLGEGGHGELVLAARIAKDAPALAAVVLRTKKGDPDHKMYTCR